MTTKPKTLPLGPTDEARALLRKLRVVAVKEHVAGKPHHGRAFTAAFDRLCASDEAVKLFPGVYAAPATALRARALIECDRRIATTWTPENSR